MKQQEKIPSTSLRVNNNISRIVKYFKFSFVILIFIFLFLNFVFSQIISPIYFQIIDHNKKATISFLQKIKDLPEYQKILEMNNNIYENTIKEEISRQENKKKEMINNLEQKLLINPRARDVLYGLYQLYLAEGYKNRAGEYLRRAKEIDPAIGL